MTEFNELIAPTKNSPRPRYGGVVADTIRSTFENAKVDPLLSMREAGSLLAASYPTLRKWIATGQIRTWRNGPRGHIKVRLSELKKFLAAGDEHKTVHQ